MLTAFSVWSSALGSFYPVRPLLSIFPTQPAGGVLAPSEPAAAFVLSWYPAAECSFPVGQDALRPGDLLRPQGQVAAIVSSLLGHEKAPPVSLDIGRGHGYNENIEGRCFSG